jgi:hypothetical protein
MSLRWSAKECKDEWAFAFLSLTQQSLKAVLREMVMRKEGPAGLSFFRDAVSLFVGLIAQGFASAPVSVCSPLLQT